MNDNTITCDICKTTFGPQPVVKVRESALDDTYVVIVRHNVCTCPNCGTAYGPRLNPERVEFYWQPLTGHGGRG